MTEMVEKIAVNSSVSTTTPGIEVLQVADAGAAARAEAAGEAGAQHRPQDQRLRGGADDAARLPEEAAQVAPGRARRPSRIMTTAPCRSAWRTRRPASGGWSRWRRCRPAGNSSAMRGTTSWPRGASTTTSPSTTRPASPRRAVIVARSSSGRSPRTRTTSPATCARSSSGVPVARDAAAVQDRDAVAALGLLGLVRGHDDAGPARRRQRRDLVPDPAQRLGIDAAPGLVQQQQRRLVQQHARDLDAAAHAARNTSTPARRRDRPAPSAPAPRRCGGRRARAARRTARRRAAGSRARSASGPGWPPGTPRRGARDTPCRWSTPARPSSASVPACGGSRPGEQAERGRLARAVGPEQAEHLAGRDLEADAVERGARRRSGATGRRREGEGGRPRARRTRPPRSCDRPVDDQRHEQQRQVDDRIEEQRARPAVLGRAPEAGRRPADEHRAQQRRAPPRSAGRPRAAVRAAMVTATSTTEKTNMVARVTRTDTVSGSTLKPARA